LLALGNAALGLVLLFMESGRGWATRVSCGAIGLVAVAFFAAGVSGQDPFLRAIEQRIDNRVGTTWIPDANKALPKSQTIYFHKEGIEGTVTAFDINQFKQLWINGMGMTFLTTATKLMAYLPLSMAQQPKEFLAIGFGMGTTVRSATRAEEAMYPGLQITVVDLVRETFAAYKYYHSDAEEILAKPYVHLEVNDGRNRLLLSDTFYDVITVDPAPPIYSAGTVNLYTQEFFTLAKNRLSKTGIFCLWFPGGTREEVHSLLRTFYSVFPDASIWSGPSGWGFYLIGPKNPVDWDHFNRQLIRIYETSSLIKDLREWDDFASSVNQVKSLLMWKGEEIGQVARSGVIITDNYPFTEFPLWRYLKGGMPLWHPRSAWLPASQRN
jgi:spermidine synthase